MMESSENVQNIKPVKLYMGRDDKLYVVQRADIWKKTGWTTNNIHFKRTDGWLVTLGISAGEIEPVIFSFHMKYVEIYNKFITSASHMFHTSFTRVIHTFCQNVISVSSLISVQFYSYTCWFKSNYYLSHRLVYT